MDPEPKRRDTLVAAAAATTMIRPLGSCGSNEDEIVRVEVSLLFCGWQDLLFFKICFKLKMEKRTDRRRLLPHSLALSNDGTRPKGKKAVFLMYDLTTSTVQAHHTPSSFTTTPVYVQ
jgi:hypothetical protein